MNSKDLTKDLKTPGSKWVKGCVSELSREWGGCDQGIEASLKVVSDCLVIPEIHKWMAEMIEDSADFGGLILKAEAVDGESRGSIIDYNLLAKAWVLGYTVKEPLGVLLVDIPRPTFWRFAYISKLENGNYSITQTMSSETVSEDELAIKITEAEAKEKYPNFKWVSLEELENGD